MKQNVNFMIDIAMIPVFLVCGITGILKIPELNVPMSDGVYTLFSFLHDWTGVAGIVLIVVHLVLHASWLKNMTKKTLKIKKSALALVAVLSLALIPAPVWARSGYSPTVPSGITYPAGSLKDGTYTGSATGYMPSLKVQVVVKGGKIDSVSIVSNNETPRWFSRVVSLIPSRIVSAQSTDISAVSGATCSSYGIMSAVEAALKTAAK